MEIKVGQWVRNGNYFGRITKTNEYDGMFQTSEYIDVEEQYLLDHHHELRKKYCDIKIANTPQELIEEGDLVEVKYGNGRILQIDRTHHEIKIVKFDDLVINHRDIKAILTPNANGGYDLQWEETNERLL